MLFFCLNANKSDSSLAFFTEVTSVAKNWIFWLCEWVYSRLFTDPPKKPPQIFLTSVNRKRRLSIYQCQTISARQYYKSHNCITSYSLGLVDLVTLKYSYLCFMKHFQTTFFTLSKALGKKINCRFVSSFKCWPSGTLAKKVLPPNIPYAMEKGDSTVS